ncbi:hypothetical protein M569_03749, partial [Genlisea aurea]
LGMEESGGESENYRNTSHTFSTHSLVHGIQTSASRILPSPLSAVLGFLRNRSDFEPFSDAGTNFNPVVSRTDFSDGEVSINIVGSRQQDHDRASIPAPSPQLTELGESFTQPVLRSGSALSVISSLENQDDSRVEQEPGDAYDPDDVEEGGINNRDSSSSHQRYEIQQFARWTEQVLPFLLLLLVVFIRQHLQGFCVTIWVAVFMFKSNDVVQKQTALKGERKMAVLVAIVTLFMVHVVGIYWWYRNDDLLYPLLMLPPRTMPIFWNAVFVIMVNDALVRQMAMIFKCMLLMYHKNCRGRDYRKQGKILTFVEYLVLLYRSLIPAPVWYRFFLNKEYGSLFSSLVTGLYLTFKLTSIIEKVQLFMAASKALSRKEVHYGAYATAEQVMGAGDLCAICQERMEAPVLLHCKHIFCEDCVSEWFERERSCPLCRALVKPAGLKSFGDGSTSLFFQLF